MATCQNPLFKCQSSFPYAPVIAYHTKCNAIRESPKTLPAEECPGVGRLDLVSLPLSFFLSPVFMPLFLAPCPPSYVLEFLERAAKFFPGRFLGRIQKNTLLPFSLVPVQVPLHVQSWKMPFAFNFGFSAGCFVSPEAKS